MPQRDLSQVSQRRSRLQTPGELPDREFPPQANVLRPAADAHAERARLDQPLHVAIEHSQLGGSKSERHRRALARREVNAAESFQLDDWPRNRRQHITNVQLRDFIPGARARGIYILPSCTANPAMSSMSTCPCFSVWTPRNRSIELAGVLKSSQSRVAKMEAGDPSVSLDLLIRSLLALGTSAQEIIRIIKKRKSAPAT